MVDFKKKHEEWGLCHHSRARAAAGVPAGPAVTARKQGGDFFWCNKFDIII